MILTADKLAYDAKSSFDITKVLQITFLKFNFPKEPKEIENIKIIVILESIGLSIIDQTPQVNIDIQSLTLVGIDVCNNRKIDN